MLIGPQSPFRRLPQALDKRQTLFLDGIRVSIEAADLSYTRLLGTLRLLSEDTHEPATAVSITHAIVDAWAVVDFLHRLRMLLERMPRVQKSDPDIQSFLRSLRGVEALRHTVQHLDERIAELVEQGTPTWGILKWVVVVDAENLLRMCTLVPGSMLPGAHDVLNPVGLRLRAPIDRVTLQSGSVEADLSDAMRRVARFTPSAESALEAQFADLPRHGSDYVVGLDFGPVERDSGERA